MTSDEALVSLPKAHLHLHLTGGMRHTTLVELADRHGVHLPERLVEPAVDDWRLLGWPRFQRLYDLARGVLRTPDDINRLVREIAEDEEAAGSRWCELQVTPTGYAARLGDVVTAMEVFSDAVADAQRRSGVGIRLVVAANRTRPAWEAEQLARLAVRFADRGVVGFGLSNDERVGLVEDFGKAFRIVREHGLIAVPHAGELLGAASVRRTLEELQPRRIGHGVRAAEDPEVMAALADANVACEVCPASNVALGVFAGHASVPLRLLEEADVPVVLAADDPLLFGAGLIDQYAAARDAHGYAAPELARLARTSVEHSAMSPADKARLSNDIDDWLTHTASPLGELGHTTIDKRDDS